MQHKVAEEQVRFQMGFNLHQNKTEGVYYKMFLFDMF